MRIKDCFLISVDYDVIRLLGFFFFFFKTSETVTRVI